MKRKMVVAALALSIAMSAVNVQAADLDLGSAPGSTGLDITILGTGNPADSGNSSGAGNESETAISEAELYPEGTPEEAKPARLASARLLLGSVGLFDYYHSYDAISAIFQSQYASYTTPGAYGDATDMNYMDPSLQFIDECNGLRAKHGLSALKVTDYLMACEEADVNWSKDNIAHAKQFNMGENLAWGMPDPFSGWYDQEKAAYESGITDPNKIGHYLNIIDPSYGTTGFAITNLGSNPYGVTMGQAFHWSGGSEAYTTKQYRDRIASYFDYLKGTLFKDVINLNNYYFDSVYWAREKGITNGVGDNQFAPDTDCYRGQMVQFLYNMKGKPSFSTSSSFKDVSSNDYFANAVSWAAENGVTSGTGNGKFSPKSPCTRAQMVQFLYNLAGRPEVTSEPAFSDVSANNVYARAIAWAKDNHITNGTGEGKFSPNTNCKRGQMVVFLKNYIDNVGI
ncbi:MAG: S-layer homology domain-containing protein [Lachnospiraceae bacterium]|nr:S-layer homology domain-containing protein [Lachnospiraceae bacterium]